MRNTYKRVGEIQNGRNYAPVRAAIVQYDGVEKSSVGFCAVGGENAKQDLWIGTKM